jgi:hypothetical protein
MADSEINWGYNSDPYLCEMQGTQKYCDMPKQISLIINEGASFANLRITPATGDAICEDSTKFRLAEALGSVPDAGKFASGQRYPAQDVEKFTDNYFSGFSEQAIRLLAKTCSGRQ